jgi:hypothetical protein
MKLKSFGCSFIWGTDMPDESMTPRVASKLTWPGLVAKHLDYSYESFAYPGVGNLFIADRVLNQLASNDDAFYIISWTFIDRFDYVVDCGISPHDPPDRWEEDNPWATCRPGDDSYYFKHYHSEYRDKVATLQMVKLCIDMLTEKNVKFLMTCIDESMFDRRWHMSPAINMLQDLVQPHFYKFDNGTFIDYTTAYQKTKTGHLSPEAHVACTQYILKDLSTQNTNDCLRLF